MTRKSYMTDDFSRADFKYVRESTYPKIIVPDEKVAHNRTFNQTTRSNNAYNMGRDEYSFGESNRQSRYVNARGAYRI